MYLEEIIRPSFISERGSYCGAFQLRVQRANSKTLLFDRPLHVGQTRDTRGSLAETGVFVQVTPESRGGVGYMACTQPPLLPRDASPSTYTPAKAWTNVYLLLFSWLAS